MFWSINLLKKLDLRRGEQDAALSNLSHYYTWKSIKGSYNNSKFRISPPTWNDGFKIIDGSYLVSDILIYFEYNLKNMEKILIIHQWKYM